MIYEYEISGLKLKTGDLICTRDGSPDTTDIRGQFWRLLGRIIPGDVDHIVVYVGPAGRCVEAGARGKVITFDIVGDVWDYRKMFDVRGIMDNIYGVAYPLENAELEDTAEAKIREDVAAYCIRCPEQQLC